MSSVIQHVRTVPQRFEYDRSPRKCTFCYRNLTNHSVQSGLNRRVHAQLVLAAHRAG